MQVAEQRTQLRAPGSHLALVQRAAAGAQHLGQRLARHIGHDQVLAAAVGKLVEDRWQIGMRQMRQHLGLAVELADGAVERLGVAQPANAHLLDRHERLVARGVGCEVHRAHAATRQRPLDAVAAGQQMASPHLAGQADQRRPTFGAARRGDRRGALAVGAAQGFGAAVIGGWRGHLRR